MAYSIGSNDLLDFSGCADDDERESQCWSYYQENLRDVTVFAFDGKLVRGFTRGTFAHIISGSSNRFDPAIGHDIKFSEKRAKCLPLIKKVLSGEIETQVWRTLQIKGKKRQTRRVLTVIEAEHKYYVVVLDEVGETIQLTNGLSHKRRALQAMHIRQGNELRALGEEMKMPRIPGSEASRAINHR